QAIFVIRVCRSGVRRGETRAPGLPPFNELRGLAGGIRVALPDPAMALRKTGPERNYAATIALVGIVAIVALLGNTVTARAAWTQIAQFLSLSGKPAPASANVLSEHHLEALDTMAP